MVKPIYEHDCDKCIFLGNYESPKSGDNQLYDLYFCPGEDTVVARYGNNGWEYASGMRFSSYDGSSLFEAKRRAIEKGLYQEK